jgi:murein DD-endopeptidase MepM/ murein hydrolase activator NlpD
MEVAQERIIDEFDMDFQAESAERSVGLLGGAYSPVNEAELQLQLEILAAELQLQQLLFQDLESHKARMENYLRNFPTLMPIDGGRITSFFGFRRDPIHGARTFHEGVDIPVPSGTPIRAAGGGTVIFEGWRGGYGNVVFIDHGGGLTTRYAHNSRHLVYVGQVVERGDIIALVGNTGRSVSPHLHYEVLRDGRQIDPMPFITEFWSE